MGISWAPQFFLLSCSSPQRKGLYYLTIVTQRLLSDLSNSGPDPPTFPFLHPYSILKPGAGLWAGTVLFTTLMLVILSLDTFPLICFKQTFPEHSFYARLMLDAGQTEKSDMAPETLCKQLVWPGITFRTSVDHLP